MRQHHDAAGAGSSVSSTTLPRVRCWARRSQLIQLGQVLPASAYLKAQRLRGLLLRQAHAYFRSSGITVLLKPARTDVGLDGLASLLGMPEVLLPTGFTTAVADGLRGDRGRGSGLQRQQQAAGGGEDGDDAPAAPAAGEAWMQPAMVSGARVCASGSWWPAPPRLCAASSRAALRAPCRRHPLLPFTTQNHPPGLRHWAAGQRRCCGRCGGGVPVGHAPPPGAAAAACRGRHQ